MKKFIGWVSVFFIMIFSVQFAFSQCSGTYFKTGYRKIVSGISSYEIEDWNGDGKVDFWKFVPNQSTLDLVIYLNNGSGDWNWSNPIVSQTTLPNLPGGALQSYEFRDFDGDGDKDIFYGQSDHTFALFRNNGSFVFTMGDAQAFQDASLMRTIGFTDLNADNRLDWVVLSNQSGIGHSIGYRLANADGTYGNLVTLVVNGSAQGSNQQHLGDFNGDGKIDIFFNSSSSSAYRILTNNGGGNFTLSGQLLFDFPVYTYGVADFNSDGKTDILAQKPRGWSNQTGAFDRKAAVLYGQANGTLAKTEYTAYLGSTQDSTNLFIGEFNGDNNPDIIDIDPNNDGKFYSVYINNGSGGFTRNDYNKKLSQADTVRFADFNGDGKTDIYLKQHAFGAFQNIFSEQLIIIQYNQCQSVGAVKTANFDGNHRPDAAVWNPSTGDWRSTNADWKYTRDQSVKLFNWGLGSLGDIPAPGDFDGDGKTDYAVYRNGDGNWYINQSSNGAWLVFKFGLPGDIAVPNDYNGGGKTDIAVYRPSDGNWHIWFSETQQYSALHFGANGDKPVPADYDGDGKTDVAVYRPSEGNWYYLRSSDGNYAVFHWGIDTDKPLPADYDGDGKADLAIYRGAGDWYILRSSNGSFNYIKWGTGSDVPMPVYENGESAAPMVYRPSSAYWMSFTDPYSAFILGGAGNVPVYFGLPNN